MGIIFSREEIDNVVYVGYSPLAVQYTVCWLLSLGSLGWCIIHIDWNSYRCYRRKSHECTPNDRNDILDWQASSRLVFLYSCKFFPCFLMQASKRNGSMIVPLELLQNIGPSTFGDEGEYQSWLKRQLRVLEAGLLAHPLVLGDGGMDAHRLRQTLRDMADGHKTVDKGKNSEIMQILRSAAMGRATRAHNSEYGDFLHWADGFPLNAHIYIALLAACFHTPHVIAEMDEALEMIQKTWGVLGIDQTMHDMLLAWVFFRQFVTTGQTAVKLLQLSESQLDEVAKDLKGNVKAEQLPLLKSTLSTMQFWAERRLLAYHDSFPGGASDIMAGLLAVAVRSAQILGEYISREHRGRGKDEVNIPLSRIDVYVRSSVKTAFAQVPMIL